jgi:hypothetical protein
MLHGDKLPKIPQEGWENEMKNRLNKPSKSPGEDFGNKQFTENIRGCEPGSRGLCPRKKEHRFRYSFLL